MSKSFGTMSGSWLWRVEMKLSHMKKGRELRFVFRMGNVSVFRGAFRHGIPWHGNFFV